MNVLRKLWNECDGYVVSSELVMVGTILVIGMVAGLNAVKDSVAQELGDMAAAIGSINQSYFFSAVSGHHAGSSGSRYTDLADKCEGTAQDTPECVDVCTGATSPEAGAQS